MSRHTKTLTRSFAGGEMSPEMFSRRDDVMFQAGAETLLNCVPKPTGAVARRSGTRLVRQTRDATSIAQLFAFVFSPTQSAVIEGSRATIGGVVGGYFRFHTNGSTLLYAQPERFESARNVDAVLGFAPCRTVTCTVASAMKVQLTAHGLRNGDQVQFISAARTLPDGFTATTGYYVVNKTADDFELAATQNGAALNQTVHGGVSPVLWNWTRWKGDTVALQSIATPEHRIANKAKVVVTMYPSIGDAGLSPTVTFKNPYFPSEQSSWFQPTQVANGYLPGLSTTAGSTHQVMFIGDVGSTLPSGIVQGKLYWTTGHESGSWRISETHGGPPHDVGSGQSGTVRMCAMPETAGGTLGVQGKFGCLIPYYAVTSASDPNVLKLENSVGAVSAGGAGIPFDTFGVGCGPFKVHPIYDVGAITSYDDAAGGNRCFYAQKKWWEHSLPAERNKITAEMHNASGTRTPGSTYRTSGTEGAYWRELPGRTTGGTVRVTANEYIAPETVSGITQASPAVVTTGSAHGLTSGNRIWVTSNMSSIDTTGGFAVTALTTTTFELDGSDTTADDAFSSGSYTISLILTSEGGGHGFTTGQQVAVVDGTMPGVTEDYAYYAIVLDSSGLRLAATYADAVAGAEIAGPSAFQPRHGAMLVQGFVAFDEATYPDEVVWPGHGLANGDTVVFGESSKATYTAQTNVTLGTVYYVRDVATSPDRFRISASAAGALLDLSGSGDRHTAIGNSIYEVPHDYSAVELPRIVTTQSGDVMTMASQDHPVRELRRLSSTKWELVEPDFVAKAGVPGALYESSTVVGEGTVITEAATINGRPYFVTGGVDHAFEAGMPVYVDGFPTTGAGYFPPGYYIVGWNSGQGDQGKNVYLHSVESNDWVYHGGDKTGLTARIRYGTQGEERTQKYVITAIDDNNEESAANDSLTVTNNLFVSGASNTIGWGASTNAVRYRVYKELNGLFGLIGETDDLTFKDDNIGPDLAVAPPIPDDSLRKTARVTFDTTADTVFWANHGLLAKMPVVFETSDEMPGLTEGATYFVLNPDTDEFQLTTDPDIGTAVDITGTDTGTHTAISGNFPATATHFEGRRVFGGSRALPQDIWMTASGTESDLSYSIPTVDSDRIYFRVASRDISSIRHLVPMSQLVLLSDSTEYRLSPINDDAVTPSSVSVRPQSFVGAGYPHPSLVNNTVVFAAARGGHMRALGYSRDVLGYLTGDLSIRAAHLFDGFTVKDQAYSKAPLPVVWCVSSSGKLLGITYIPEENVGAWHQHTTPGTGSFESVAVVPEGDEDAVYVVVKRTLNNVVGRYVERFAAEFRGETADLPDAYFVDCGLTYDGAATTTVAGLDHLEGEAVSFLADGVAGTGTIANGTLTLTTAAAKVHVGLGFTTTIKTLPLSMMRVDAFGTGRQKNVNQVWVRIFQSGAFDVGPGATNLSPSRSPASAILADDVVQVTIPASWDDDGQVFIQQDTPVPLTVSGLTIEVASGG